MANSQAAKPSTKAVKDAEAIWGSFVQFSKVSIYAVVAVLFALWLLFIA